ncbi:hypothetical protein B296_00001243 [Ensete ventricosum]|uniref:Uncharacterized protein n=1 Tax=Ensete ventricosum TaxID=4639 RepID=A0A427B9X4_ENSVE|nr:hypothetical protein B296_00001243 [Ensete ventricosum]
MIRSYWELHFSEQCNDKKGYGFKACMPWYREGGSSIAAGELDYFSAHIRLRELDKSEDKAEDGTSMEPSIPCSHRGRALVVKGAEEVENVEANSQYPDRVEW